jgi:ribose 5-phosphate isomerase B
MIALGSDHAGYELKLEIIKYLDEKGLKYKDYGTFSSSSVDYPVYGELAARAVAAGECDCGILVCGTGVGIGISANKVHGIRCASVSDCYSAEMAKRHNDANMIALGARVVGVGLALKIIDSYLDAEHEGGRHAKRVGLIMDIENR